MVAYAPLGSSDGDLLFELNSFFARVFPDPEIVECPGSSPQQREGWLSDDRNVALVARDEGAIIGGLVGYRLDKIEGRREFYIYDLAVDDRYRRRGVATELITRLCKFAREQGAWVVYVQADTEDVPAVALYTKLGTREDVLHFDLDPRKVRP